MIQRWWQRPGDGIIFMVADPDHIARIIRAGWREVERPEDAPAEPPPPVLPETTEQIKTRQIFNDEARAAFSGAASARNAGKAKRIRPADERGAITDASTHQHGGDHHGSAPPHQ